MSDLIREPYEISVWEDYEYDELGVTHISERKIAIIGSDTHDSILHAFNPRLKLNTNQDKNLTFTIYQQYRDLEGEDWILNPLAKLLQNETKVKLKYRNQWHDFLVKDIYEDSISRTLQVTCKDLHVVDLSRKGNEVELDIELENNIGTIEELAETIFADSDWTVGSVPIIRERNEEAVYEVAASAGFTGTGITTANKTFTSNSKFLIFYSDVIKFENNLVMPLQVLHIDALEVDRNRLVLNEDNSYTFNATIIESGANWRVRSGATNIFILSKTQTVSDNYRAKKYIQAQQTVYDAKLKRYVQLYKSGATTIYGYQETQFVSPIVVKQLATNNKTIISTVGWEADAGINMTFKTHQSDPSDLDTLKSYLFLPEMAVNAKVVNTGLRDHVNYLMNGIVKGEEYIVRIRSFSGTADAPALSTPYGSLRPYIGTDLPTTATRVDDADGNYLYHEYVVKPESYSYLDIVNNKAKINILNAGASTVNLWIEEIEVFKAVWNGGVLVVPDSIDTSAVQQTVHLFYDPDQTPPYNTDKDVVYLEKIVSPNTIPYTPVFDMAYTKRRSMTVKKSNYFNLGQELAEKFECWMRLDVEHDADGKITTKTVNFVDKIGEFKPAGFVYGIDLNSIGRSVNTDQITTKIIVEPNQNELAEFGYTSIAEAEENYAGENFLFNFNYYIQKGLIPFGRLNMDLYGPNGYLKNLNVINKQQKNLIDTQLFNRSELIELKAQKIEYENRETAAKNERARYFNLLVGLSGQTDEAKIKAWLETDAATEDAKNYYYRWTEVKKVEAANKSLKEKTIARISTIDTQQKAIVADLKTIYEEKKLLTKNFNKTYYRFVQEGSWTSQDYYDNNLYYFDAISVLHSSAFPQIQYNIKVANLSALEEFKGKVFNVGDITTIEDTEYFGYTYVGVEQIKTPYREEIIVTEITYNLDEPEKDEITVQNYRSNFEDLFQRITATTQSLQLNQGSYNRVASIMTQEGAIDYDVLQHSLIINRDLVFGAKNESVAVDHTGITMTDLDNTNFLTRYSSKGLFFSDDGGTNWSAGVTARGVSVEALTAGSIFTDRITITQGGAPTFRWNAVGLTAYKFSEETGLNPGTFVRHDQFGFYGIKDYQADANNPLGKDFIPVDENDIWDKAHFALTWKGFNLKTSHQGEDGYVRITSASDEVAEISVGTGDTKRVELGRLGTDLYGIRISDGEGRPVLTANSDGTLSLEEALYIRRLSSNPIAIGVLDNDEIFTPYGYVLIPLGTAGKPSVGDEITQPIYEIVGSDYIQTEDVTYQANKNYYEYKNQVLNANYNFIVFEDGSVIANDGTFRGAIYATSGHFTGTIEALGGSFRGEIEAISGRIGSARITDGGLVIQDGTFRIEDNDSNSLFDFDGSSLVISGNASFEGALYATSGKVGGLSINENEIYVIDPVTEEKVFSVSDIGDLMSLKGQIGGIQILPDSLTSSNFIATEGESGFSLDSSGTIIAKNIQIGSSAIIEDYLRLGSNAILYNPDKRPDSLFIESGDLRFFSTGEALFGDIQVSGSRSEIRSNSWMLTPELASFSNISASGTISSMVFESNTTRAVGGTMIFKTSAKPIGSTNNSVTLETKDLRHFFVSDWVALELDGGGRRHLKINEITATDLVFEETDLLGVETVIRLGSVDANGDSTEWVIGVNSENTRFQNILEPNAITFSSFKEEDGGIVFSSKMVLGRLDSPENFVGDTYGIFAETAFLKGTLTTRVGTGSASTYAGVNTLTGASYIKDTTNQDLSKIVFWAGALDSTENSIQEAPFQVTERGTLYANQGYFRESVFVEAVIEASVLRTSKIVGVGNNPALSVHTTEKDRGGIVFVDDLSERATMTLDSDGINVNSGMLRVGDYLIADDSGNIEGRSLTLLGMDSNLEILNTPSGSYVLKHQNTELLLSQLSQEFSVNNQQLLKLSTDGVNITAPSTSISNDLRLGEGDNRVVFQRTAVGYDVYIS